jgi:hypothetical protein
MLTCEFSILAFRAAVGQNPKSTSVHPITVAAQRRTDSCCFCAVAGPQSQKQCERHRLPPSCPSIRANGSPQHDVVGKSAGANLVGPPRWGQYCGKSRSCQIGHLINLLACAGPASLRQMPAINAQLIMQHDAGPRALGGGEDDGPREGGHIPGGIDAGDGRAGLFIHLDQAQVVDGTAQPTQRVSTGSHTTHNTLRLTATPPQWPPRYTASTPHRSPLARRGR